MQAIDYKHLAGLIPAKPFNGPLRRAWLMAVLALLLLCAAPVQAQYRTSIQGAVTDPQGAVVPGATLTLTDAATNQTVVRTSDAAGVFNFNALPADHFTLDSREERV